MRKRIIELNQTGSYLLLIGITTLVLAWGSSAVAEKFTPTFKENQSAPVYKPPLRGAPKNRVGGGVRGTGTASSFLTVLAPEHTGLTLKEQPTLYWYLSSPVKVSLELSIIDDERLQTLVEQRIEPSQGEKIQHIRLTELDVQLKPGIEYRWNVALISNLEQRSNDTVSSASIKRVSAPHDLQGKLSQPNPADSPGILAEAGFWYDAFEAVSELIEQHPEQTQFHQHRATLLEQVNLKKVADSLRK